MTNAGFGDFLRVHQIKVLTSGTPLIILLPEIISRPRSGIVSRIEEGKAMKIKKNSIISLWLWSLVLFLLASPGEIMAQGPDSGDPMPFRQEELDQMLAPIALYPDDLLSQVLIAATYPLEVVEAARWIQANSNLGGDQLAAALEQKDWDPSVKSLVNFPSVLLMMSDNLEWTEMIGDAFLAGEDQVMDTIQRLRQKAQSQGYLRSTNELIVDSDPQTREIIIEPYDPEVVYVPVYDPIVVYGPWWWPAYPPFRYYPRGGSSPVGSSDSALGCGLVWPGVMPGVVVTGTITG